MASTRSSTSARQFSDFESEIIEGLLSDKALGGRDGVFTDLIKHVVETTMQAELGGRLAREFDQLHSKPNKRNGRTLIAALALLQEADSIES
jgi:hypothetical protein